MNAFRGILAAVWRTDEIKITAFSEKNPPELQSNAANSAVTTHISLPAPHCPAHNRLTSDQGKSMSAAGAVPERIHRSRRLQG